MAELGVSSFWVTTLAVAKPVGHHIETVVRTAQHLCHPLNDTVAVERTVVLSAGRNPTHTHTFWPLCTDMHDSSFMIPCYQVRLFIFPVKVYCYWFTYTRLPSYEIGERVAGNQLSGNAPDLD
jgi:hypothetical protein